MSRSRPTKPFVVWLDYGQDGWSWREYDTTQEAIEDLQRGGSESGWVLTRLVPIIAAPDKTQGEEG